MSIIFKDGCLLNAFDRGEVDCIMHCTSLQKKKRDGELSMSNEIFVFGSNLAGRHGKGAAMDAFKEYGAVYGVGVGLMGSSYAIPTKGFKVEVLLLEVISTYVEQFKKFAAENPQYTFKVTRIGCGLAGYNDSQIAPMFKDSPPNCTLPEGWRTI